MPATDRLKSALSDRYRIEREIGAGGMATVYLARDLKHDREVALKVLRADLSAVIGTERFLSEVRITARLDHPHILTLIDSGEAEGILFYVLPYVRGESLRSKITRERQLGVEEALSIAKQVASALDYAHERGVVHRDIKPENILLHEGEAVLADFGIALAVKEAGGNRLTETGLSLGTPQYMSPEQATGDRALDKRSDIYSLGAVFYEMLAGEPPVTGATAQAMIAKLLTERPVKLRVVRQTVSLEMEGATERALAKVPADRFSSAGEFVRALSAGSPQPVATATRGKWLWIAGGAAAAAVIATGLWMAGQGSAGPSRIPVTLSDRTQITSTGRVSFPDISDDGKTLAYVVTDCGAKGCRYAVEMQDVAGGPSRRLVEGATAIYRVDISPDRRNVLVQGTFNGTWASWLVSALGGAPRFVAAAPVAFWAGGDSLLYGRPGPQAKERWILVAGLDGTPVDSIRVDIPGEAISDIAVVPNSQRFFYGHASGRTTTIYSSDRSGRRYGSVSFPRGILSRGTATHDALWLPIFSNARLKTLLLRIPFDPGTGELAARYDTVFSGLATQIAVTADGSQVVMDEGTTEFGSWKLSLNNLFNGRFEEENRLSRATSPVPANLSPDGRFIVASRSGAANDARGREWSVTPWDGGTEIRIPGLHRGVVMLDSSTVIVVDVLSGGTEFSLFNIQTKQRSAALRIQEERFNTGDRIPGWGWAWVPSVSAEYHLQRDGDARVRKIRLPSWYRQAVWSSASRDGKSIAFAGWSAPTDDSLGIGVLDIATGRATQVWSTVGEFATVRWLSDGSLGILINDTPQSFTLYRARIGGAVERLGSSPRPVVDVTFSDDLKRAVALTRDYQADAYLRTVVTQTR